MKKLFILCLFVWAFAASDAQKLPEQYREKFSESYPIRKEQHLEIKVYIDKLLNEEVEKTMNFFQPDFFNIENYENSLYPYRKQLGDFFGYPPPNAKKGEITQVEKVGEDKYSVLYRIWIEVVEDVHTYGILMIPKGLEDKAPLIVAIHGGGGNPEAICGLDTRINYHSFGYEAVKKGYIVWAPGLVMLSGYGGDPAIPGVSREQLDYQLKLLGTSIIGLEIHKIIESTKVLINNRPEIDSKNIGMTGLSWGGFFTVYATALCPIITAAAPSANFRDFESELRNATSPEFTRVPDKYSFNGFGNFQAVGMICPRPCLVQIGEKDKSMVGAATEAERSALYYKKLGISDRFIYDVHVGGHEFENESIFRFFDKYLR